MMVGMQAFINMTVVTGMAPTKGIPLPLVSAGGSSLVVNLLAMGILLNISQQASSQRRRPRWTRGDTLVIAGGGTGGHLYPGIAVARELLRRDAGCARVVCRHRARPRGARRAARRDSSWT